MDPELIAYLDRFDRNFAELRQETTSIREEIASFRQETEHRFEKVEAQIQETRVITEDLYAKVQTVAEGVVNNSEVIERFRGEVTKEFSDVRSEIRTHGRQSHALDVRVTALEKSRLGH
jgi:hypothetical protein